MKLFLIALMSLNFAFATSSLKDNEDSAPPTPKDGISELQYEEYEPNDGSARPGNPGTFTSKGPESTVPETNLEMKNVPKADDNQMQAEEAEFDDEVLK